MTIAGPEVADRPTLSSGREYLFMAGENVTGRAAVLLSVRSYPSNEDRLAQVLRVLLKVCRDG